MRDPVERTRIEIAIEPLIRRDRITRRSFMRRMGAALVAVGRSRPCPILAACGQPAPGSGSATVRMAELAALHRPLEDEVTYPSIEAFTEQTGLEVEYNEGLLDNADFLAQYSPDLQRGQQHRLGRDVARRMGGRAHGPPDWLEELDHTPAAELDGELRRLRQGPVVRPRQPHSVGGRAASPASPTTRAHRARDHDLRRPARPGVLGGVGGFSDMRDMFGLTLLSLGVEPANATVDDVTRAATSCCRCRSGHFRGFYGNEYYDALAAGDLAISRGVVGRHHPDEPERQRQGAVRRAGRRRDALERQLRHPEGRRNLDAAPADGLLLRPVPRRCCRSTSATSPGRTASRSRSWRTRRPTGTRATPRTPTTTRLVAPTVVPTEDQSANTFTDKELTEDEEAEWNDLWRSIGVSAADRAVPRDRDGRRPAPPPPAAGGPG